MRKMITLFQRNYGSDDLARNEVMPGAEWVLAGEGLATRKHDGTCCMVRDGRLYKRYDAKGGKPTPVGFEPAQEPDQRTGHWPGWVPVGDGPDDRWFREAFNASPGIPDGTYELCGPKVQGNPEKCETHVLIRHGSVVLTDCPRDYAGLRDYLVACDFEGIVWHHPDGRMVKLKRRDFVQSGPKRRS